MSAEDDIKGGSCEVGVESIDETSVPDAESRLLALETAKRISDVALNVAEAKIREFRAGMHDANNLLAPLMGYLELAKLGLKEEKPIADLNIALECARNLAVLLNRAMRANSELQLNKEPLDLNGLINIVLISAKPFLPSDITVDFVRRDGLVVYADRASLHSALLNLVKNAAEALEGIPNPKISLDFSTDDENVMISVIDNGPGIPVHLRERIFTEKGVTTKGDKGHGLGLPMVKRIVEAHGGNVSVESVTPEEGDVTGTRFTVVLSVSVEANRN